jgi:N-acetylglutamate synthase-like GNAT family acetyltransferase
LEILSGESNQVPACLSIAEQLPQYFTSKAIQTMAEDLKAQELYIAKESGQIFGFITYHKKNSEKVELSWLAVHPKHHHKSVGTKLVEHVLAILKAQEVKEIIVKTLAKEANYPPYDITRNFFEKLGFIHQETIDPYPDWEPGNPCAVYIKTL